MMNNLQIIIDLTKTIAFKFKDNEFQTINDIADQIDCLFLNRIIQDVDGALRLSHAGYFGSARTLLAVIYRNIMMFASLVGADQERINSFWNEEADTYQDKMSSFSKDFSDGNSIELAKKNFGDDTFSRIEFEKSLHGSCFALRKYYTDRAIDNGLRTPVVTFGPFKNQKFTEEIESVSRACLIDFLGVLFTKHLNKEYLKDEFDLYYKLAQIERDLISREGSS